MDYRPLGTTNINVSSICLGTMTWGSQNTEKEAHGQLDYALERGVNFMDTAELYPIPPEEATQGRTEQYIGTWLEARKNRDKVILATKVVGGGRHMKWFRGGSVPDRKNILSAVDASLKRLRTDYIDLYQIHWPDRIAPRFGGVDFSYIENEETVPLEETLSALDEIIKVGKVRYVGVSNETPWGLMKYFELSKTKNLPRIMSIQNHHNLLNRRFEMGLSEVSWQEKCGLLAWSPLAGGLLTGKYIGGARPDKARFTLFGNHGAYGRFLAPNLEEPVRKYVEVAKDAGVTPAQLAIKFIADQPFVTSVIIGATNLEQLKENIDSAEIKLSADTSQQVNKIHGQYPNLLA